LTLEQTGTLETLYDRSLARTYLTLLLLAMAGGMALLQLTTAFVRRGLISSAIGCACGLAAALLLTPLTRSLLFPSLRPTRLSR